MTTPVGLPNFQQLRKLLVGRETVRGTKATVTNKWYGRMALRRSQPLADSEEYAGTFFADYTPVRGAVMVDGTYDQKLSYEDAHLFTYAIKGGVVPVSDAQTTPGYTSTFRHTSARDDIDTFSAEFGDPAMISEATGLLFPEWTVSSDIDDAQAVWKFSAPVIGISKDLKTGANDQIATGGSTTTFVKTGAGWVVDQWAGAWVHVKVATQAGIVGLFREVLSNTATTLTFVNALPATVTAADVIDIYPVFTAGVTDRAREDIKGPGTKLYLDTSSAIGTTEQPGRLISFSVTSLINASYKRFMDNVDTMSNRLDRGMVRVNGQVRIEFDRKREWDNWKAMQAERIRIRQTGSTIDSGAATKKSATIDVFNAQWDTPTEDVRGNNITVTWPFRGYVDATQGVPIEVAIKNRQASLLA